MATEDSTAELFQPDCVLPQQYFTLPRPPHLSPEQRLMLAVLEEAIMTLLKHRGGERSRPSRQVRDVRQWVLSRSSSWPFAFENICAGLNLDADYLRSGLCRLTTEPEPEASARVIQLRLGRRVAGRRHRVGLILPHHKAAAH